MSAPRVILLDSNAYFRLAHSIRPLLATRFGPPPPFSRFVLPELDLEYRRSPRLRTKFDWVASSEYVNDRMAKRYACKGKDRIAADNAFSFLAAHAKLEKLSVSAVDLRALVVGFVRNIPVVSDDHDLRVLAESHAIEIWGVLRLLKLMIEHNRIDLARVREVVEYWNIENDLPMGLHELRAEFQKQFGAPCPV